VAGVTGKAWIFMNEHENLTIRIPADLKRKLEKLAAQEDRSVNQQVCRIIREAVDGKKETK